MKIPKIPSFLTNFYVLSLSVLFIWMLFFDPNDFINQYRNWQKYKDLEKEKLYYSVKIEQVKKDRAELMSNSAMLEKFAREKYLMKKKSEDIYVIEQPE